MNGFKPFMVTFYVEWLNSKYVNESTQGLATNDIRETLTGRVFFFTVFSSWNLVVSNHFKNHFVIIYFRLFKLSLIWSTYQIILIRSQIRKCQISFTLCSSPYEEIWGSLTATFIKHKIYKIDSILPPRCSIEFPGIVHFQNLYFIQTEKEILCTFAY